MPICSSVFAVCCSPTRNLGQRPASAARVRQCPRCLPPIPMSWPMSSRARSIRPSRLASIPSCAPALMPSGAPCRQPSFSGRLCRHRRTHLQGCRRAGAHARVLGRQRRRDGRRHQLVHEGVTEREIADQMLGLYRNHGCEGFSFPPIVSFGANNWRPASRARRHRTQARRRGAVRHWRTSPQLLLGHDTHVLLGRDGRGRHISTTSCAAPTRPPRRSSPRACACATWTAPRAT